MLCAALGGAALGGTLGIVIGYTSVVTFLMLPGTIWILVQSRAAWHRDVPAT